ncbi:hypothetical protein [uncultured Nitrospira sp.]|uniref:hypothetical protein n=1 Tax=uncultured Nitrospira sp. TaxID=157176 RepID=UPI00313FF4BB
MKRQNFNHFQITIGMSLIVMVGFLALNPSTDMGMASEGSQKKERIQGEGDIGQIIIEGEVTRIQGEFVGKDFSEMKDLRYEVKAPLGRVWDLHLGDKTQKIGDIFLGDHVKASVGKDGSLQTVQKIEPINTNLNNSVVPRRITGKVEQMERKFLVVKQGEQTEILHLDDWGTLEGDIHEGGSIVAQFGEAGYAINIEELQDEPGMNSD